MTAAGAFPFEGKTDTVGGVFGSISYHPPVHTLFPPHTVHPEARGRLRTPFAAAPALQEMWPWLLEGIMRVSVQSGVLMFFSL